MPNTNQQHVNQRQGNSRTLRLFLVIGGILHLTVLTALVYWLWNLTIAQLDRWHLIEVELGYAMPWLIELVRTATPLLWCAIGFMIGLATLLVWSWRAQRPWSLVVWMVAVTLVAGGAGGGLIYSTSSLDAWMASTVEIRPPLTVAELDIELANIENPDVELEDKRTSLQKIRFIALKHAAGLIHVEQPQINRLCDLVHDHENAPDVRFMAAWALLPIDHSSPAACHVFREGYDAAQESDDEELREFAAQFKSHPCLIRSFGASNPTGLQEED